MSKLTSRTFMLMHLSWRNLFRHRRRTLITMMSIAFGTSLALIYVGIRASNYTIFVNHAARMNYGHVSVLPRGFLESTSSTNYLVDCKVLEQKIKSAIPGEKIVPRIMAEAVLASGDRAEGVAVLGVDLKSDSSKTLLTLENSNAHAGQDLNLAGKALFDSLNIILGDRLVVHTQTKLAKVASTLTTITSTFTTHNDSIDSHLLVLDIQQARSLFEYSENECSFLGIFISDPRQTVATRDRVRNAIGTSERWGVYTWEEVNPDLINFIKLDRVLYSIILCFVILIIGCGILATVMMNAQERKREIGILIAIGMTPFEVFTTALAESFLLSTLGCLMGLICSMPLIYYLETVGLDFTSIFQSRISAGGIVVNLVLHCSISKEIVGIVFGLIMFVTALFSLYPALKLAFIQPIDSIENRN